MAQPFKRNQFGVGGFNFPTQTWMGRRPAVDEAGADYFKYNMSDTFWCLQEMVPRSEEIICSARPEAKAVVGEPIPYIVAGRFEYVHTNIIVYDKYRFTPVRTGTLWLNNTGAVIPLAKNVDNRAATYAHFHDNKTDRQLLVVSAHLNNQNEQARIVEMGILINFFKEESFRHRQLVDLKLPIVFSADSNINME
ncbi:MAG: hypothetical protein M3Q64_00880, partial [bacterium]|nr:hypothetical protein [bacterium]